MRFYLSLLGIFKKLDIYFAITKYWSSVSREKNDFSDIKIGS